MRRRSLHGYRILLTGASSGIGHALARQLASHATHLLLVARREAPLTELAKELTTLGAASAETIVGDVADPDLRAKMIARVHDQWSGLDLLINNAGVSAHGRFGEHEEQTLRQIMEVNFFAAAELTRSSMEMLSHGRDPLVVNIGSILGHRGVPHNSEYCASKFALRGWSEAIRPELQKQGIDLLMISPGTTDTEFFEHLICKSSSSSWGSSWGKPKGLAPEKVARQIVHAIERRRNEIFPNWRGRLLVGINRLCPRLLDRVMNRFG